MKQEFENGTVLLTDGDMIEAMRTMFNKRNNYERDCKFCMYEDSEHCDGCSISLRGETGGCSCHINPPCSYCVESNFEPSIFLINYKHFRDGGKWRWECFKSTEEVYNKLTELETNGYELSAETLSTGEITIYIENNFDEEDSDLEFCNKNTFKSAFEKLIMKFSTE